MKYRIDLIPYGNSFLLFIKNLYSDKDYSDLRLQWPIDRSYENSCHMF